MIIPILLYHGKERWEYHTLADLFENLEPELKKFLPDFDYVYNNLGNIPDEEIELLNNTFLVASILTLKHSFEKDWLGQNAFKLLMSLEDANGNLRGGLIVYLFARSGLAEDKIKDIVETLPLKLKDTIMSTLDIFIEKGKKIGFEEGMEKGKIDFVANLLKNTDFDQTKIAALANVSEDFVAKIRQQIGSQK